MNDDQAPSPSRRQLFKKLSLVPIAAIGVSACAKEPDRPNAASAAATAPGVVAPNATALGNYSATFFTAAEWSFILAACDRLIPADSAKEF